MPVMEGVETFVETYSSNSVENCSCAKLNIIDMKVHDSS
jgi:hypothetical protein